ncbi:MAG: hypothetical protein ACKPKO_26940, partial [Candidatus Fonsibacter sp.]
MSRIRCFWFEKKCSCRSETSFLCKKCLAMSERALLSLFGGQTCIFSRDFDLFRLRKMRSKTIFW